MVVLKALLVALMMVVCLVVKLVGWRVVKLVDKMAD